jgi:hypothetical protein
MILFILGFIKVLVNKNNKRDYKDTRIKRTIIIAIEYINTNNRYLNLIIIWPIITYRSN